MARKKNTRIECSVPATSDELREQFEAGAPPRISGATPGIVDTTQKNIRDMVKIADTILGIS